MTGLRPGCGPIVVGVDGSHAALNAVRWATTEAVAQGRVLRVVHAVVTDASLVDADADMVLVHAENASRSQSSSVRVETVRVAGAAGEVLLAESGGAAMVCVGSRESHSLDGPMIGPVADLLAQQAACPVAVIRTRIDGTSQTDGVISVVVSDEPDNDVLVHAAMHEGRVRHATVRQIDLRADSWIRRYPDVHVETVAGGTGRQYRRETDSAEALALAVVGPRDAQGLASMTLPNCHPILGFPECSVLIVRPSTAKS
jgi:nucleotide-binding universal stress UspA family protein